MEELPVVVVHCGSRISQYARAGIELPLFLLPTVVARSNSDTCDEADTLVGAKALEKSLDKRYRVTFPIKNGVIVDMTAMEEIWRHIFYSDLRVNFEKEGLILTEPILNPKATKERTCRIMFETFGVQRYYTTVSSVLSLFASGRVSGIVFDSGHDFTAIVPVYEGYVLPHGFQQTPFAGKAVDEELGRLLQVRGYAFEQKIELEILSTIKQSLCFVSENVDSDRKKSRQSVHYTLPNNRVLTLGKERFECAEVLFREEKEEFEGVNLSKLLLKSINSCDREVALYMYPNILFTGGNTLLEGLRNRVLHYIKIMAPTRAIVKIVLPPKRKYSAWTGGSILATLSTFPTSYITRAEYEEYGAAISHRKCSVE